jgi:Uma2 family endonuclease
MTVPELVPAGEYVPTADQRIVMSPVPWESFEAFLALRADRAAPRLAYLDGAMELMSPSRTHEGIKSYLGMLIEAFALDRGIRFSPYGSWTLRQPPGAAVEPDECYLFGDQRRDAPDLVIEVIWTSGGIDKLEIYRRLGVREVWVWRRPNDLAVLVLEEGAYRSADESVFLPGLDLALVTSLLEAPTAFDAVQGLRAALR